LSSEQIGKTHGFYIVVSAPSGTGKTSILREVIKKYPNMLFSVSYTTRPPRPGEKEGKDYCFISEEDFRERIFRGEFAEWVENYGYLYGTHALTMKKYLEEGYDLILDIEPRGAKKLKEYYSGGVFVFILPPSLGELKKRLSRRGFESERMVDKRMYKALDELGEFVWYDYIILNDKLDTAVNALSSIYVAEKCKRERLENKIRDLFL